MNILNTVFISAFNSELTNKENLTRHEELQHELNSCGYIFTECLGSYDDNLELSFCVDVKNTDVRRITKDIFQLIGYAKHYNQQCILYVDSKANASLFFDENTRENIGVLTEVTNLKELIGVSGYSFINNRFYIVK